MSTLNDLIVEACEATRKGRGYPIPYPAAGTRFGNGVVVRPAESSRRPRSHGRQVLVRCDCGSERVVSLQALTAGQRIRCTGCIGRQPTGATGMARRGDRVIYDTWKSMRDRCTKPSDHAYCGYGARGITVCERWLGLDGPKNFAADMGPKPVGGQRYTLDRIDNERGYSPENCRWVTHKENQRNKRTSRFLTFGGETLNVAAWAERFGLNRATIRSRIKDGWSVEAALVTPRTRAANVSRPPLAVGDRFSKWTVIEAGVRSRHGAIYARCRCDCGREFLVAKSTLHSGASRQCLPCAGKPPRKTITQEATA